MPHPPAEPLHRLGLRALRAGLEGGRFTPLDIVESCLDRIAAREPVIGVWAQLDPDFARQQAGRPSAAGPLAGIPFGAKDVFDSADLATEMGSTLYAGHRPRYDAGVVGQLRAASAILLGKTVTAEFAGTQPTRTSNPHQPDHTPGGSSSGSAAAVADFMVPFALGTQTGGSVLRPAAFCGVVGFKPSFGLYSPAGMKIAAHSFDTVGLIARSIEDVAIIHGVLMGAEPSRAPVAPRRIGVLRTHLWETADADSRDALRRVEDAARERGTAVVELDTPSGFDTITERRAVINAYERARGLAAEWAADPDGMSPQSADVCRRGSAIGGADYVAARRDVEAFRRSIDDLFAGIDLLLTPVTPGEAPAGKTHAGDPRLQELWTMLHLPSATVPVSRGGHGLPVGVQLVGARFDDDDFLARAAWIEGVVADRR